MAASYLHAWTSKLPIGRRFLRDRKATSVQKRSEEAQSDRSDSDVGLA